MSYRIKKLDEDFYNPYDDEIEVDTKPKKPVHISDKGGMLKPRREIFNINRVVYSKRPNGEYTVMAKTQFAKGEIIEISPIIFVGREAKAIARLKDIIFEIEKPKEDKEGMYGLVLGYGSLYKHSDEANVEYAYNRANRQMYFKASRTIQAHEELTINYGKDYWQERASFNTLAPKNETPAQEVEENVGQSQAPSNPAIVGNTGIKGNPAVDGVAAMGGGQS
jgi:uncharacterized protein